jgi:hypothetical protein
MLNFAFLVVFKIELIEVESLVFGGLGSRDYGCTFISETM